MKECELHPARGSKRARKRVGRGGGSGHGTYACRGLKGQKSRSKVHPLFEGGQTPLVRRLPQKRGFTNFFRTEYAVVNLERLNAFANGTEVGPELMVSVGILKGTDKPIKVLGGGELTKELVVKANRFSRAAKSKIGAAGGRVEQIQ